MSCFLRASSVPSWSIKPNITILLPVFNQSKFLKDSLDSILKQVDAISSKIHLNIKVLNDGSTEPINPIIQSLVDSKLIEYREQSNQGLASALNTLSIWEYTESKQTDFITWHSADNIYLPESLFKMASFLSANPDLDFTYANVQLINESGEPLYNSNYRRTDQFKEDTSVLNLDFPTELLTEFSDNFINACFLERRVLTELIPPYDPKCKGFEDYVHWMNMSLIGTGNHLGEKKPMYKYRLHDNNLTSQLGSEKLAVDQKSYLNNAQAQQNRVHTGSFEQSNVRLKDDRTNHIVGDYSAEIKSHIHASHQRFQKISAKVMESLYGNECFLAGSYEVPEILKRARERYLGLFGSDFEKEGRVLIFVPDDLSHTKDMLLKFITQNRNLGIILYTASRKSRISADSLFLESNLPQNLRIVDAMENSKFEGDETSLLNAIGSCDAVISITSFFKDLEKTLKQNTYLINDFSAEACLAASAGRVLLAPEFIPRSFCGPLPHILPWASEISLPNNLPKLKTDLTHAHYDSILRSFSQLRTKKKQIYSLIFSPNLQK